MRSTLASPLPALASSPNAPFLETPAATKFSNLARPSRRRWLQLGLGLGATVALPAGAQGPSGAAPTRPAVVVQIADMSPAQQDISRDFLVGSRAAWQELAARGGASGRPVQHLTLEIDGSRESLQEAWRGARDNPACVALVGTTGHVIASELSALRRADGTPLAHVAPWLQNSSDDIDGQTFPIFAGRQEQIAHALRSLATVGVQDVGVVYATPQEQAQYRPDVERAAATLKLGLRTLGTGQPAVQASWPAIVLFPGGTPELARFTQSMERQAGRRQSFIVALADVNLQTLAQMGVARSLPVIVTQPVPVVTASLPVVRAYRAALARLFDEPPSPHSLAGYLAARYTQAVLAGIDGALTRANVLGAFSRRADVDLGGYRIAYGSGRRAGGFVTQSLLAADGRIVG